MNSKFWLLIASIIGVVVLAMGWFLGISPRFTEIATANEQRTSVETQNAGLQKNLDSLEADAKNIDSVKAKLKKLQVALPPGDQLSTFLDQLHQLEADSGVLVTQFTSADGVPFVSASGAGVSAAATATNAPGKTASAPATTAKKGEAPLATAVNEKNFIVITITLKATGTRDQVLNFVDDLQTGPRLFLVNSLTVAQTTDAGDSYTGSITGFVYVLVDPSAPPPTPTPIVSLGTTPTPSPTPAP